jgi:hypothetical protein
MNGPNPYEAPRHAERDRPAPRRKPSWLSRTIACAFALLGSAGGSIVGPRVLNSSAVTGEGGSGIESTGAAAVVCGLLGAVLAAIVGHFVGLAVSEPPTLPDPAEAEAEAKRQKVLAEIAVAQTLLDQAARDGDEDVRAKLVAYKAKLERKLRA